MKDPVARIVVVGCVSCGALGGAPPWYLAAATALYGAWTIAARIPPRALAARARGALLFLALIVVVNAVTTGGEVVIDRGGLLLTREGFARGAAQAARLCLVLWGALITASTVNLEDLQDALERWTSRRGIPLVAAGGIAINYLPTLVESARRVMLARKARGEDDRPGPLRAIVHVSAAALPVFAAALRNADALAEAMESRCYDTLAPRTRFRCAPLPGADIAGSVAAAAITLIALAA
ncbi:MAG TPA: energy-coupling factor transporter transmembrane component T [Bacteroidota bacterium]|nr:energy-coupling factor transporter transmembrane component T [Bacteroidota bacterium]